jgi:hypothetical protein
MNELNAMGLSTSQEAKFVKFVLEVQQHIVADVNFPNATGSLKVTQMRKIWSDQYKCITPELCGL